KVACEFSLNQYFAPLFIFLPRLRGTSENPNSLACLFRWFNLRAGCVYGLPAKRISNQII
ncbi:hypothetical protein, partial [Thalassospira lucentensis]|uniref:hypothetical protein n=1 Tax=Thalassospira lucentensis TaxID=168935 RepID=UPI0023F6F185